MKYKTKTPIDMIEGSIHKTNNFGNIEIVEYISSINVKVRFLLTGYSTLSNSVNIRNGELKDMLSPSVYGVGIFGDGIYKSRTNGAVSKSYKIWCGMLERCYDPYKIDKCRTYMDCYVCEEWLCYQVFAKWFNDNYIAGFHVDKDIIVDGNKAYSPSTCMFVSRVDNNEKAKAKNYRFKNPSGEIIEIYNLSKFCRLNNLNSKSMCSVHIGNRNHHKGWVKA